MVQTGIGTRCAASGPVLLRYSTRCPPVQEYALIAKNTLMSRPFLTDKRPLCLLLRQMNRQVKCLCGFFFKKGENIFDS